MTTFEKIVEAIKPFDIPYEPDIYHGSSPSHFVYNYADERGGLYGDDVPVSTIAAVQVHLYLPKDMSFTVLKKQVKKALLNQGFTYPEVTVLIEDKKRHITFECEIEEEE